MRGAVLLVLAGLFACARQPAEPPGGVGVEFRPQCQEEDADALETVVQGITAWFGPPRRFPLDRIDAVTDAQGHPAIRLEVAPEARAAFEAWTTVGISGPIGIFVDGELVAVPAIQPVADGRFQFCNEAGGWSAADRDRWLARLRAAAD